MIQINYKFQSLVTLAHVKQALSYFSDGLEIWLQSKILSLSKRNCSWTVTTAFIKSYTYKDISFLR